MGEKMTAPTVQAMKAKGEKIVCITAYDAPSARLADLAGVDVVLVGDSVANAVLGHATTLQADLPTMVHHTAAVARALSRALLVADLPFGSYQSGVAQAVDSAVALVRAGAAAVKLEGDYYEEIAAIVKAGIPVMGHVGMTPQSVNAFGGFRVQGRGESGEKVVQEALRLEQAGAFAIVLELIPSELASEITGKLNVPTIGIGAGPACSGQIQVWHDILGLATETFKHAKRYLDSSALFEQALRSYAQEVRSESFPTEENSF